MSNLSDEQWSVVESCLPIVRRHARGGRPAADNRKVLDGILWVMRSGSSWRAMPPEYPSRSVCRRRFSEWKAAGVLRVVLVRLAEDLRYRKGYDPGDPELILPLRVGDRASWWWQTVLLLRSSYAAMLLAETVVGTAGEDLTGFEPRIGRAPWTRRGG